MSKGDPTLISMGNNSYHLTKIVSLETRVVLENSSTEQNSIAEKSSGAGANSITEQKQYRWKNSGAEQQIVSLNK